MFCKRADSPVCDKRVLKNHGNYSGLFLRKRIDHADHELSSCQFYPLNHRCPDLCCDSLLLLFFVFIYFLSLCQQMLKYTGGTES